jgi:hypothetical protein
VTDEDITALYIAAIKRSLGPSQTRLLAAAIEDNKAGFALNRASFGSAMNTYYGTLRSIARDILHAIFFQARGAPSDVIKEEVRARVDTIHEMLGLGKDEAVIRKGHPLLGEYPAHTAGYALRFFPTEGKGAVTIARPDPGSETNQFLEALGKAQIANLAISYKAR